MKIEGSVALVTGADRGLGQADARELVRRGAAKVYGAARHPGQVTEPGVTPVALDITDPGQVGRAAEQCADVSLLVNNAGVLKYSTFIGAPGPGRGAAGDGDQLLRHAEHVPGVRAGAGGQRRRGDRQHAVGHQLLRQPVRRLLWRVQGGRVVAHQRHPPRTASAGHAGHRGARRLIDTDMAALVNAPKISPQSMARQICDAVEAGQVEVLADERTRFVKASLPRDHELIYPPVQEFWDAAVKGTP